MNQPMQPNGGYPPKPRTADPTDADIAAAESSALVKMAAAIQAVTGLFVLLNGLQLVGALRSDLAVVPYVHLGLGAAQIVFGAMLYRARRWASLGGIGLNALTALVMVGWFFYSFTTIISCMMYVAVPLTVLALILGAISVPSVKRTADARERLADQGMNLGL